MPLGISNGLSWGIATNHCFPDGQRTRWSQSTSDQDGSGIVDESFAEISQAPHALVGRKGPSNLEFGGTLNQIRPWSKEIHVCNYTFSPSYLPLGPPRWMTDPHRRATSSTCASKPPVSFRTALARALDVSLLRVFTGFSSCGKASKLQEHQNSSCVNLLQNICETSLFVFERNYHHCRYICLNPT